MTATDQLISRGSIRDLARIPNEAQPAAKRMARSGAWGEPDDIAAAAASLLSDADGWITGQRIEISGGQDP